MQVRYRAALHPERAANIAVPSIPMAAVPHPGPVRAKVPLQLPQGDQQGKSRKGQIDAEGQKARVVLA